MASQGRPPGMTAVQLRRKLGNFTALTEPQLKALVDLTELYAEHGLIRRGKAGKLWQWCPNAETCWADPACIRPDDGGLTLPWVGPAYRRGKGVVVLGINHNDASGLERAFEIASGEADGFANGYRRITHGVEGYRGTDFPYRSTLAAAAVLAALAGEPVIADQEPYELIGVLNRTARVQAIKCSPESRNGAPSAAMWHHCPPMLLVRELEILRPAVILAFGTDVRWALEQLEGYVPRRSRRTGLNAATLPVRGRPVTVVMLAHPAAPGSWGPSYRSLLRALKAGAIEL